MQDNLLVAGTNQMVDNMRGGGVSAAATEPFATNGALNNACDVVDSAVPEGSQFSKRILGNLPAFAYAQA